MTTAMNKKAIVPAVMLIATALVGMVILSPGSATAQQFKTSIATKANPTANTATTNTTKTTASLMQRPT